MLDRCQRLFFKNLFYEAARDSKSLNCNIIIKKRFFWHLSQLLTNLLFLPTPPQFSYFPFPSFFSFSLHHHHIFIVFPSPYFCCFASSASSSFLIVFLLLLVLISIVFRPFSPHFYCLPSLCFCCFLSSSSFLLFCLLLLIHHFHIDHNASCPPPPPLKFSMTIVSNFCWVLQSPQEKSKTMVMQNCGSKQVALWLM